MSKQRPRIVVRIEIATLSGATGRFDRKKMDRLAMVLATIRNSGTDILVVTSGAIALGAEKMKVGMPSSYSDMQVYAAIGQADLIRFYQRHFDEYNQIVAQVLLTSDIMDYPERVCNARNTFNTLLEMNIIPVINENDPISSIDIELGDNYPLARNVADIAAADAILVKTGNNGKYYFLPRGEAEGVPAQNEDILFQLLYHFFGQSRQLSGDFPEKLEISGV